MLTAPFSGNISIGKRLLWESDMGQAFCEGGLNYSDGYLWVPEEGYYNLMLQITYKHTKETSASQIYHLSYTAWVISGDYKKNVPLMTVQDSMNGSMKAWSKSLHVSRLLHLAADSKLMVTSSHTSLIGLNEDETFFGVERSPR
ncbi:tumor necrosis factor ligand superfamily member 15-like [Synchiropus splendidus]|uniref:tumor necrosis factor ligand superfamily member 15-like n=1 Tax=Synchiropus splendidus TaxID=270530 RepID=UPI00237D7986|nr:tumor necrosis factor ligand superfamily member 15-like [Synchiropus splendidus]